eukprot:TRINITY_DN146_c0_g2_i1.p1 TRINITY_DN146_c0_g2~~TRINITY_DN146_c0_g2_i1.p1  ORF type:complete len:310 (+),score=123.43 TRINITY_DN146_c0_g2_i1:153-1082(+)
MSDLSESDSSSLPITPTPPRQTALDVLVQSNTGEPLKRRPSEDDTIDEEIQRQASSLYDELEKKAEALAKEETMTIHTNTDPRPRKLSLKQRAGKVFSGIFGGKKEPALEDDSIEDPPTPTSSKSPSRFGSLRGRKKSSDEIPVASESKSAIADGEPTPRRSTSKSPKRDKKKDGKGKHQALEESETYSSEITPTKPIEKTEPEDGNNIEVQTEHQDAKPQKKEKSKIKEALKKSPSKSSATDKHQKEDLLNDEPQGDLERDKGPIPDLDLDGSDDDQDVDPAMKDLKIGKKKKGKNNQNIDSSDNLLA